MLTRNEKDVEAKCRGKKIIAWLLFSLSAGALLNYIVGNYMLGNARANVEKE